MVSIFGNNQPFSQNVFTLGSCDPRTGCQIYTYNTEEEMLLSWKHFVTNPIKFDLPYLVGRA